MPQTRLRPVADADEDRLLAWRNTPHVARWMYTDHAIAPTEHARWFAAALGDPTRADWIIEVDGVPAGLASLYGIDTVQARASWAFYLAAADVRGRGVGAWVEFQVIEDALIRRGLNKLWCEVLADNDTVARLHLGFGFRQEAVFRQHVRKQGRFTDVLGLGLLRDEWLAVRADACDRLTARGHAARLAPL